MAFQALFHSNSCSCGRGYIFGTAKVDVGLIRSVCIPGGYTEGRKGQRSLARSCSISGTHSLNNERLDEDVGYVEV